MVDFNPNNYYVPFIVCVQIMPITLRAGGSNELRLKHFTEALRDPKSGLTYAALTCHVMVLKFSSLFCGTHYIKVLVVVDLNGLSIFKEERGVKMRLVVYCVVRACLEQLKISAN